MAMTLPTSNPRRIPWIPILAILFVGIVCFHEIDNFDTWMNVRAGAYILDEGTIPKTDVFSHTAFGREWVYHEWLAAVGLEIVRRIGGEPGLVWFTALIAMACFALMLRGAANQGAVTLGSLLVAIGILAGAGRFSARCHLFTLLFFSIFLFILENNRERRTRWLFVLVPLQLIWANLHGGFAVGIVLLGAYTLGGIAVAAIRPFKNHASRGEQQKGYIASLFLVLAVAALVTLINPYGLKLALKPFLEIGGSELGGGINEWAPPLEYTPFPPQLLIYYKVLLVLAGAALLAQFVSPRPTHILLIVAFTILSLTARRHIALFALTLVPLVSSSFVGAFGRFSKWRRRPTEAVATPRWLKATRLATQGLLLIALVTFSFQFTTNRAYRRDHSPVIWGSNPCPLVQPIAALDYLSETGVVGTIFNNYSVGGYIAYRLYPEKIFLDGRNVMYGDFLDEYEKMLANPMHGFPAMEERFGVGTVVLRHTSPGALGLIRYLKDREDYSLAYFDEVAAIFLKGEYETVEGCADPGDTADERFPVGPLALGQFYNALGELEKARGEFNKAAERDYPVPQAHYGLATLYRAAARIEDAEREARLAVEANPRWADAHSLLAAILLGKSPPYTAEAEGYLLKALAITPKDPKIRLQYAFLLANSNDVGRAEEMIRAVVDEYPDDPGLVFSLAQLYEGRQKRDEAKATYLRVIELDQNHAQAPYALAAMAFQERAFQDALPLAIRAVELAPTSPKPQRLLAEINKKLAQEQQEEEEEQKASPDSN